MSELAATLNLRILKAALFAASKEETRYHLNGVSIEVAADHTTYIATDGHVLFTMREELAKADPRNTLLAQWIIPSDVIAGMKLGKQERWNALSLRPFDKVFELARLGGDTVPCEMVDGTFPHWRRVLGKPNGQSGTYDTDNLVKMKKIGETLDPKFQKGDKSGLFAMTQDPTGPAHISWPSESRALGVVMPIRGDNAVVPAWLEADLQGVLKPKGRKKAVAAA